MIHGSLYLASVSLMLSSPVNGSATPASPQSHEREWRRAFASAEHYTHRRLGRVSFALVDDEGRLHSYHGVRHYHSASLVKAMLLVAYLNQPRVRHHRLDFGSRALLRPMIVRSDNRAASRVRGMVGNVGLARVARRAGMQHFASATDWGSTHIAAGDQARFFYRIDRLVPRRHRLYARSLLAHVIGPQRWGVPQALPSHTRVFFKGGWRPERGAWVVHQAALVERGKRRASLAVLTDSDRTDGYGHETIRGIAKRVLRPLARP
jgi:hypothetical protein